MCTYQPRLQYDDDVCHKYENSEYNADDSINAGILQYDDNIAILKVPLRLYVFVRLISK